MSITRRAFYFSLTPSHPADHGHRNRVAQTDGYLASLGYEMQFFLYPMDGDWENELPPEYATMKSA